MALVTPPKSDLSVRDDKENGRTQLDTPSTSTSNTSKSQQRVIFSNLNKEHFFPPLLAANPTPSSTQEPSKSILKKRTYEEFLADDLFPPERTQRASTPEPENPHEQPTYLLSPIQTLVQSIAPGTFDDVPQGDIRDLIEAYCILSARIRANLLEKQDEKIVQPALEPLREYLEQLADVLMRDISRAREDPIQSLAKMGVQPAQTLPSPPPSSPAQFDSSPTTSSVQSEGTPKKGGMNEQQVKHARDLCTLAQSAIKCFSSLLCFTGLIHANMLFSESQLSSLVGAVLAVPLASPLPTPNSRKTCALAVGIINSFSGLPVSVLAPHTDVIATVYKRGISGELGREGKKGSTGDALRGVVLYSIPHPQQFAHPFGTLLPPILKLLNGPAGTLQSQAGFALCGLAYASTEKATPIPGVSEILTAYLNFKQKQKNGADLPQLLVNVTKFFQSAIITGSAEPGKESKSSPAMQAACQTTAMWALCVFSSFIVLADRVIFKDVLTTNAVAKILRVLLASKRVGVRTAASWGWRAFAWACMREFNELDVERQDERCALIRRTFDFLEKGVATGLLCSLLVGSDGREDRDTRIELSMEILLDIAKKRGLSEEAVRILIRLLSDEKFEGGQGPSLGWDLNKLLPTPLFDGSLGEADGKTLANIVDIQRDVEKDWADDIPPLTRLECQDRLEDLFEVWQCAIKGHGVDNNGYPTTFILESWALLLKRSSLIPEARMLGFITDPPYTWTNLAQPGPVRNQQTAHQVVHARYIKALWLGLIKRFGSCKEMQQLALQIYDQALSLFDLEEGKVEDVALEMFYILAEVNSSIVVLMMGHEEWSAEMKHTFWMKSCKAARDKDLIRALCVAPFGEPAPFELSEDDWVVWDETWKIYMGCRGESERAQLKLLRLFCEELGSSLAPADSARIAGHVLESLPKPLPPSDLKVVLSFINQSLALTYESQVREALEITITNLRSITDVLHHLDPSSLLYITPSLVQWTSDEEGIMDDREYDIIIGQVYGAVLRCVAREEVNSRTLEEHCELLSCIKSRITPSLKTVKVFHEFWVKYCSDIMDEDVPREMNPLLMVMGSHTYAESSEDQSEEADEVAENEYSSVDSIGSSDEVLSLLATAEALEQGSDDTLAVRPVLEEQDGEEEDELEEVTREEDREGSPTPTIVAEPSAEQSGSSLLSLHTHLEALDLGTFASDNSFHFSSADSTLIGSLSGSPGSKKRRLADDDECTPVKRRRQEFYEDDEEEVDDRTPVKPWFGDDEDAKADAPIPFVPFTKHNLPTGVYHFTGESSGFSPPAKDVCRVPSSAIIPIHPSLRSRPTPDVAAPLFVNSTESQHGSPSSKRRRVGGPETPLALEMDPYSDDALPSSDPVGPEPGSDDSLPSGNFSPEAIVSPPMAPAVEPSSDDSHESPLKALLERKKRMRIRSRSEDVLAIGVPAIRPTSRQALVDQEAKNAMTRASSLFSSMDTTGLLHMSSLLEQMRSKVQDELRRKSDI